MSFGKPSAASEAAWTAQTAGAYTQQIEKDERMARRALDAKLAKLEAEQGEVCSVRARRHRSADSLRVKASRVDSSPVLQLLPPPPPRQRPVLIDVQPVAPKTNRALHSRTMPGYLPRPMQSTAQEDFTGLASDEPLDRAHFHKLDAVGRHAEAQVRFAALMKDGAVKAAPK